MSRLGVGILLAACLGAQAKENLVPNGDFETAASSGPPPGWVMWGATKYKDPANFTRDTTRPHGGQACFRIHHPARTAGYVVSSPDHALRTERGVMFEIRFWARSDRPGSATIGFDAYESLRPFVGAPSPGFHPLEVGTDWKEFRFEVHEGWDFFADRVRFLLLVFKATSAEQEERTLWIDDVAVDRRPSPRKGRLVDLKSLEAAPEHRLRPGDRVEINVDAAKRVRRATRLVGGVSFHRVAGWSRVPYSREGEYVLHPDLEAAIRDLKLPMTRFYGVGDEPFGVEAALDKAADVVDRVGIPQETVVLEFETQGATSRIAPEDWARGIRHSVRRGYRFRHWEISNEPYLGRSGQVFATPDEYADHFLAVAAAIRQAQPDARIGIPVNPESPAWCSYLLQRAAGRYDFVVGHHYCFANVHRSAFEDVVLTANYEKLADILRLNALIRASSPGREAFQLDTEWGMHSGGPGGEKADAVSRNGNIVGTLHRAVRLIYYAREEILRGASSWEMFTRLRSPGFGFLSQEAPGKRSMFYWLYWHFNRHVGEQVLEMDGRVPWHSGRIGQEEISGPITPALVTLSGDGKAVYVVMVNGSWGKSFPCRLEFRDFIPARAVGVILSHGDPDAHSFVDRKEEVVSSLPVALAESGVSFTLPPHAAAFLELRGE